AGTTREVIDLNSASATFSGNTLTINPSNDLIHGVDFYVNIQEGAIIDFAGNEFAGIFDATTWNFTAELAPDLTAPFVTTITPYDGRTHIAIDSDLTMYFSENVQKGSGNILIKIFSTDATVQTIDVASGAVTIVDQLVTINPASDLGNLTEYYVELPSGVFQDLAGNEFAGYAKPDWSFTTIIFTDVTSPSIVSLSPIDGVTNLNALDNFTITFDEPIKKGSGFLQIYDDTDALIQNINSALTANVIFDEYSVTINPTSALAYGKTYYFVIPSGIIKDLSNNAFSLAKGEWDFSTSATDTHNPNLIELNPINGAVDRDRLNNNLFMTFDEKMMSGAGNVYVRRVDNDAIAITKAGTALYNLEQINPWFSAGGNVLDYGTEYYIEVEPTAITDLAGNPFAGIAKGEWHFTTEEDVTPPTALSQSPTHNTTGYGIINNIIVFFNEPVQLGVGAIILTDAVSGAVLETYNENSPEVSISGGTGLVIDPSSPYLLYETQYSVEIGSNVIQDLSGNPFEGIAEGDWLFTTADKQTQSISFSTLPTRVYGSGDFTLNASATSSLPIIYEVVEGPISIEGSTVSILGAGDVTIRATQAGNDTYQAAVSVEQSFTVTQQAQSISFGSQPDKIFGVAPFALSATASSGFEVGFTVVSGPALISSGDVIITGVGTITIAANQSGDENIASADEVQRTITVSKSTQIITFNTPANKVFGDAVNLDATSNSGLEINYSVLSGPATVTENTVSITGVGTVNIRASQAGNVNYTAAADVDRSFTITQKSITITADAVSKIYGEADPSLTYQITTGALESGDDFTGSLSRVSGEDAGTYVVNVETVSAGANYNLSFTSADFTITQKSITITADAVSKIYGEADPSLTYQITAGTLESGDDFTGSLSRLSGEDAGAYAVNVETVSAGSNYNVSFTSSDLTITQKSITITADAVSKVYGEADPSLTYQITAGALESGDD
ncbi:MAG: Ig-like domain-containing protein, partial [Reichenbachiella sp.]